MLLQTLIASLATLALASPPKPDYPMCGGYTPHPLKCDANSTCVDDPRTPGSCGMACDIPGICMPKSAVKCQTGRGDLLCPKGQKCFADRRVKCPGLQCKGFCMYPKE